VCTFLDAYETGQQPCAPTPASFDCLSTRNITKCYENLCDWDAIRDGCTFASQTALCSELNTDPTLPGCLNCLYNGCTWGATGCAAITSNPNLRTDVNLCLEAFPQPCQSVLAQCRDCQLNTATTCVANGCVWSGLNGCLPPSSPSPTGCNWDTCQNCIASAGCEWIASPNGTTTCNPGLSPIVQTCPTPASAGTCQSCIAEPGCQCVCARQKMYSRGKICLIS